VNATIPLFVRLRLRKRRLPKRNAVCFADFNPSAARLLFAGLEKLLGLRNDVGLLSEEYYPETNRLMGNFPQVFSHVALVNTALNISRQNSPVDQRARPAVPDKPRNR
jgi:GH15 family glucan-1,4-alpha-glucosidase